MKLNRWAFSLIFLLVGLYAEILLGSSTPDNSAYQAEKFLSRALTYEELGDIDNAIEFYKKALNSDTSLAWIYGKLGNLYTQKQFFDLAVKYYKLAAEYSTKDYHITRALHNLGIIYTLLMRDPNATREQKDKYFRLAEEVFKRRLKYSYESYEGYGDLGRLYEIVGDYKKAERYWAKALKLNPEYLDAYFHLSSIYEQFGTPNKSVQLMEEALKIFPKNVRVYGELGRLYDSLGRYEDAIKMYQKITKLAPGTEASTVAFNNLAMLYKKQKIISEVIDKLQEKLAKNPSDKNTRVKLAEAYERIGEVDSAVKEYTQVLKQDPQDALPYYKIGLIAREQGDDTTALSYLKKAVKQNPGFSRGFYELGITEYRLGKYAKAIEYFKRALDINPQHLDACFMSGESYMKLKRYEKAYEMYGRALEIQPYYKRAKERQIQAAALAAEYFAEKAKWSEVQKYGSIVYNHNPQDKDNLYYYGVALVHLGEYYKAVDILRSLRQERPNFKRVNYYLALAYHRIGNNDEAMKYAQYEAKLYPKKLDIARLLGDIYYNLGAYGDAVDYYKRYLQHKSEPLVKLRLAQALEKIGQKQASLRFYNGFLRDVGDSPELLFHIGSVLEKEYIDSAIYYYQRGYRLHPTPTAAEKLANLYYQKGDYEKALPLYLKAYDHISFKSRFRVAQIYYKSKNYDRALKVLGELVALEPNYADAYILRGYIFLKTGRYDASAENFKRAKVLLPARSDIDTPLAQAQFLLGSQKYEQGKYFDAVVALKAAQPVLGDSVVLKKLLGLSLYSTGQKDEARPLLEAVYAQNRKDRDVLVALRDIVKDKAPKEFIRLSKDLYEIAKSDQEKAELLKDIYATYDTLGDTQGLISALKTMISFFKTVARYPLQLADIFFKYGNLEQAEKYYKIALKRAPADIKAHYKLVAVLKARGETDELIKEYEILTGLEPQNVKNYQELYRLYSLKNDTKNILRVTSKLIELGAATAKIYKQRAQIYLTQGDTAQAVQNFEGAIKLEPTDYKVLYKLATLLQKNDPISAAIYLQNVVELKKDYLDAEDKLEQIYLRLCKLLIEKKIDELPPRIAQKEDFIDKFKIAGYEYLSQKKRELAIIAFTKYLQYKADPEVYFELAQQHSLNGNYEKAYDFVIKAISAHPTPALKAQISKVKEEIITTALGNYFRDTGFILPANIKADPLFYQISFKFGDDFYGEKEYNKALKAYKIYEAFDTSDRRVKLSIGRTLVRLKRYDEAYSYLLPLVEVGYQKDAVVNELTKVYAHYIDNLIGGKTVPEGLKKDKLFLAQLKERGKQLIEETKLIEARRAFEFYTSAVADDGDAYFYLGEIAIGQGNLVSAYYFYKKALKYGYSDEKIRERFNELASALVPKEIEQGETVPADLAANVWYYEKYKSYGLKAYNQKDYKKAQKYLIAYLRYRPKDYEANFDLGDIYFKQGNYVSALKYLYAASLSKKSEEVVSYIDRVVKILAKKQILDKEKLAVPDTFITSKWFYAKYLDLARMFYDKKQYKTAVPFYETYLKYERADSPVLELATCYYKLKEYEAAEKLLTTVLHLSRAKELLAKIYFIYANQPDVGLQKRIDYLEKAVKLVSQEWEYHYQLGRAYWELGDTQKAIMHFEKSVKLSANTDNLEALVYAYYDMRFYSTLKPYLEKLLTLAPENLDYHELYANVLEKLGDYESAINEYENILRFKPTDYYSLKKLSELYYRSEKYDSAVIYTRLLLKRTPTDVQLQERLAQCYDKLGEYASAAKIYVQLSQRFPSNVDYARKAYQLYFALHLYDDAVIYASKVLNLLPQDKEALQILAKAYSNQGDYVKAINTLLQYTNLYPDDMEFKLLLARAYNRLAQYQKSRKVLEDIIVQSKENQAAKDMLSDVYYSIAMNYLDGGEYKEALEIFEKLSKLKKVYPDLDYRIGVAYWNLGEYDKAVVYLERAKKNYADDPFLHKYLGISYKFLGNTDAAITEFKEVLKRQAFDMETLKMLVDLYLKKDMLADAVQIYKRMLKIQMTNADLYYKLGQTYERLGDAESALNYYKQAINFAPGYLEPYTRASNLYIAKGDYASAKKLIQDGLKINPRNEDLLYLLARVYEQEGNKDVLSIYKKITDLAPASYKAHYYYGLALLKSKKYDDAVRVFNIAEENIQIFDEEKVFKVKLQRGLAYYALKDYDRSEEDLKAAYKIHSDSAIVKQAYFNTLMANGNRYYSVGKYNEARLRFETALMLYPDNIEAHYRLGQTFFALNNLEEALNEFKIVEAKNDKFEAVHRYLGDIYMAMNKPKLARKEYDLAISRGQDKELALQAISLLDEKEGKLDSKIESYKQLLLLNPENPKYYFELASALRLKGQLDEALRNYQKALDFKPDYTEAYVGIGEIYYNKAKYSLAIKNLQKALDLEPYNIRALELLGDVYNSQNLLKKALTYWTKAASLRGSAQLYKKIAKAYIALGTGDKAIEALRQVLQLQPEDMESRKLLIDQYSKRKLIDLALDEERKLIDFMERSGSPGTQLAKHYFNYGYMLYKKERFAEAINYFKKAISLSPNITDAYFYLAKSYKNLGADADALKYIEKAKALDSGNALYFYTAAQYYMEQNQLNKALADLLHVREIEPKFMNINTQIAELYEKLGEIDYAIKNYSDALLTDANKAYIYGKLGRLYLIKDMPQRALSYFKKQLQLDNSSENAAIAYNSISQIYIVAGLYERAIENAKKVLNIDASSKSKATAYYNIATVYYYQNKLTLAQENCIKALTLSPNLYSAQLLLARIYLARGETNEAYTRVTSVLNAQKDNAEAYDALADVFLKQEMYKKALDAQKRATELVPTSSYYWGKLANIYVKTGDYAAAENAYKKVLQLAQNDKNKVNALLNLAYVYYITGNYDKLKNVVQQALELQPKNIKALYYLGKYYQTRGLYDKAVEVFKNIIEQQADMADAYFELGRIYLAQNLSKAAIEYFNQAINLATKNAEYHYYLGRAYELSQNLDQAMAEYKKATIYDVYYVEAYNSIGEVLMKKEQVEDAYGYFLKATQIDPNYARAHINLGQIYYANADYQKAIKEFNIAYTSAAKFSKDAIDALNGLGVVYDKLGNYDDAIKYLKKALDLNSKSYITHFNLGLVYKHAGLYEDATLHFKAAIALEPLAAAKAHSELGNIYYAQNKYADAVAEYEEALKLEPENYIVHTNIGFIYMQMGNLDMAIKHFKMALNINPAFVRAHINLGIAYYYKNMYDLARKEYNKALELLPKQGKISDPLFLQLQELLLPLSQNAK